MENLTVAYKNVESFCFDDANIILYVQQDNPEDHTVVNHLFRIHKAILSLHSSAFGSMFLVPIPPVGSHSHQIHDGLLMFRMFDELKDVTDLLQTFYYSCSSAIIIPPHISDTPVRLRGLLHIAQKYQVNELYKHIVTSIKADWPQTLPRWDFLEAIDEQRMIEPKSISPWDPELEEEQKMLEPAAAIHIAREFNIPEILPAAFYHLSRIKILCDYDEVCQNLYPKSEHTARWDVITREDMTCLMRGKEENSRHHAWFYRPNMICHCRSSWNESRFRMDYGHDPLKALTPPMRHFTEEYKMCKDYQKTVATRAMVQREEIRCKLPEIFHLPMVPPRCDSH